MSDAFYVGYQKVMPEPLAKFLRPKLIGLVLLIIAVALIIVTHQRSFPASVFEFGKTKSFEGFISEKPYPTLLVLSSNEQEKACAFTRYYLVNRGKHGAEETVRGMDGQKVKLEGSLIYRDDQTMIELAPNSIQRIETSEIVDPATCQQTLGHFTLRGEIVDSKCFLGVMKPGDLKPHRACAIRCISGGCPPVFVVRDTTGRAEYFLLVSSEGQTVNDQVLDKVAEPLEITGEIEKQNNMLLLKADPTTYRRIH